MDEIDDMFGALRGDAAGFRREIAALRAEIGGPLVSETERAGQAIERAPVMRQRFGVEIEPQRRRRERSHGRLGATGGGSSEAAKSRGLPPGMPHHATIRPNATTPQVYHSPA